MSGSSVTSPIANPSATQAILDEHGLSAKKSYGQNFLVNDAIIKKICDLADVQRDDKIIEIGPGLGVLTIAMLKKGARVLAIEKDPDMADILKQNVDIFCGDDNKNLKVLVGDALKINFGHLRDFAFDDVKLVSNLPYNVAAPILITYFQTFENLTSVTAMVQKEIAERILSKPGSKNYGAYTVKLAMYAKAQGKFKVSPNNFIPAPRVDSMVVRLDRDIYEDKKVAEFACAVADAAFSHRRKTISNSIKQFCKDNEILSRDILKAVEKAGFSLTERAENLSPSDFFKISRT